MISSMYTTKKKKREVDPNAPPRPTLLGHEKEMKTWRQQFADLSRRDIEQQITMEDLKRKVNRLQSQVDAMASYISRRIK